jgi:DNA mismatch repair protein MutS2
MDPKGESNFSVNAESQKTLEFHKILEYVAGRSHSILTSETILNSVPSTDKNTIEQRLTEVTELRAIFDFDDPFPMESFENIKPALKKARIIGNYLEPQEFLRIKQVLFLARRIAHYFHSRQTQYPVLVSLAEQLAEFPALENQIDKVIDEASLKVRDNASKELSRIRREITVTEGRIRHKIESVMRDWAGRGYLQESLVTLREGRPVLMVKEQCRNRARGMVHDQSSSGATLFMEPLETLEFNNHLRQLALAETREIQRILVELTDQIRAVLDDVAQNLELLVTFDRIFTCAGFSSQINGVQPILNTENRLNLLTARHPLLLLKLGRPEKVVPLNLNMGAEFSTLIISGSNAGGKTVALKTLGLLALMVQTGFHIPVFPDSEIPIFEDIFADIGDSQSIENDLSTFSSHIQKLKLITEHATCRTLVLLDEIGAGTDPEEGAALASAILLKLTHLGCLTIATTHHGALKIFAFETDRIENASMQFNSESLEPTYRLQMGIPGSSYAFEIAQRYGLSTKIIETARKFLSQEKRKVENLIVELESRIQQQEKIQQALDLKQTQLDSLTQQYQENMDALNREKRKHKKHAVEEADKIIQQANARVEQTIKEIREKNASRMVIQQAKKQLEAEQAVIAAEMVKIGPEPDEQKHEALTSDKIKAGEEVFWKKYQSVVTILEPSDSSGKVLVEAGHLKIRVPLDELVQASRKQKKIAFASVPITRFSLPEKMSYEIDLRGQRAEDAVVNLDKFIDQALLVGLSEIRILHGKGTGALKVTISEYLRTHPAVRNQKEAAWNDGAAGVTLVQLKA